MFGSNIGRPHDKGTPRHRFEPPPHMAMTAELAAKEVEEKVGTNHGMTYFAFGLKTTSPDRNYFHNKLGNNHLPSTKFVGSNICKFGARKKGGMTKFCEEVKGTGFFVEHVASHMDVATGQRNPGKMQGDWLCQPRPRTANHIHKAKHRKGGTPTIFSIKTTSQVRK